MSTDVCTRPVFGQSLKPVIAAPSPDDFGWYKSDTGWHPIWTMVPAAALACRELIKCGCKAVPMCRKNCKYEKVVWRVQHYVSAVVTVKYVKTYM